MDNKKPKIVTLKIVVLSSVFTMLFCIFSFGFVYLGTKDMYSALNYPDIIVVHNEFFTGSILSISISVCLIIVSFEAVFYRFSLFASKYLGQVLLISMVIAVLTQLIFSFYYQDQLDKRGYVRCHYSSKGFAKYAKTKNLCYPKGEKITVPAKNNKWR